jgi:rod shape-determining protein MreC
LLEIGKAATIAFMKSRRSLLPIFFLFFLLALGIFFTSQTLFGKGLTGLFEQLVLPIQQAIFHTSVHTQKASTPESQLKEENAGLLTQLAEFEKVKKENRTLQNQLKNDQSNPKKLLPAQIIGQKEDSFILDKGSDEGIKAGSVLIYKNNLIGKVVTASVHRSVAELLTKNNSSFTVKTSKTSALGIGKGKGGGTVVIDNVVLADKLEKNDIVVTKGDIDENGSGYPPDLVVGKIVSVNKKASALFQAAEVEPLVDFEKMEMVFVIMN